MALKFGKVENNSEAANRDYAPAIQMGIENAPTKLIVKYITDMYSNPLRAALRETVSNALDAAIAAGGSASDIEFHIDPPMSGTSVSTFCVLDKGAGMTYDTLVNVYTQYGVSNKRDDEVSTGAFGLGAKSPLAYTDEFSVITKTKEDGCLFVRAYRTADDDFIADLPVKIDGATELEVWRNSQGRIVPKTLDENGDIAPMPNGTFKQSEMIHDVFGDGTGTIVSFHISAKDLRDAQDIVSCMRMLLNTYDNADYENSDTYTTFDFGMVSVDDANGNNIEMRVLAQGSATHDYFTKSFTCFSKACEGVHFELDEVAFKVGNWLYPADGKAWQPDFAYSLIIDVPSRALPFTPSRDNLRRDGDNDNAVSLARIANDYVIEKLADDKVACEFLNTMTVTQKTGGMSGVRYSLRSLFPNSSIDSQLTADKITVYPRNGQKTRVFDTSELLGFDKWSVADLVATPACVMGSLETNSDGTVRNTGIYVTTDLPTRKIFGAAVGCTHNGIDVSGTPDYGTSKSRTIADGVYGYSYEQNGTIVYSYKHLRDAAARFSSLSQTPFFPFGCAMLNIGFSTSLYRKQGALLLIDASQAGIAKVRNIVKRVAEAADYDWRDASTCRYALIPPKSANENWNIEELNDFVELVEDMCRAQNTDFVFADAAAVDAALAAKPKSAPKKTDTLSPMLSNGRIIRLEATENEAEPEKTITKLAGSRRWKPNAKNIVAAMREYPANWGVVVASDEHARAYEVAYDYAHAMLALDLVPENIVNIACISSHNFSVARASALAEIGVAVIYDECGKGTDNALIAKGTFTLNDAARYNGYIDYNGDDIPAPLADYRSYLAREALHDAYYNTMKSTLTGDRWGGAQGYSAFSLDWVKIFSMGHEDAAAVEGTCPEEDWRCAGFNLISGNKGTQGSSERFDEKTREQMSRVDDCCRIWRHTLEGTGLKISLELLDSNKLNGYAHLADALGVASTIDSYYRGVPLDDLLA